MKKIAFKNISTILVVIVCIVLIVLALLSARPIEYITENKFEVTENTSDLYSINKQFEEYKKELKDNYKENIDSVNTKFNLIITLVGIAITVWVGLNIYNTIQKSDLENIKTKINNLSSEVEKTKTTVNTIHKNHTLDKERVEKQTKNLEEYIDKIRNNYIDKKEYNYTKIGVIASVNDDGSYDVKFSGEKIVTLKKDLEENLSWVYIDNIVTLNAIENMKYKLNDLVYVEVVNGDHNLQYIKCKKPKSLGIKK